MKLDHFYHLVYIVIFTMSPLRGHTTETFFFIIPQEVDCSNTVYHNRVQALTYNRYSLFTCCWD